MTTHKEHGREGNYRLSFEHMRFHAHKWISTTCIGGREETGWKEMAVANTGLKIFCPIRPLLSFTSFLCNDEQEHAQLRA